MHKIQTSKQVTLTNFGKSTSIQALKEFIAKIEEHKATMNLANPDAFSDIQFETEEAYCKAGDCEQEYLAISCDMIWKVPDQWMSDEGLRFT